MSGVPVVLSPEEIERELTAMWSQRGGEDEPGGVTHFTLGNVIWVGPTEDVGRIRRIFSDLVSRFPCRLFLLEHTGDRENAGIESFVNAYCFASKGHEGEVCCEEITLRFGEKGLEHVAGAVLPLLISDVPVYLWYSLGDPERHGETLQSLSDVAERIVTEVAQMEDPAAGLREMAESESRMTSLSWYRSYPVREQVAALFDEPEARALVPRIRRLRIGIAGNLRDVQALTTASMLAGWFAARAGWSMNTGEGGVYRGPEGPVDVEFTGARVEAAEGESRVAAFEAEAESGDCVSVLMTDAHGGAERLVAGSCGTCRGIPRFVHLREWDEGRALGFAFNSLRRHDLFREAAAMAWPVLGRVLGKG